MIWKMKAKRKPTSKQALYSSISSYADEVIQRLVILSKSKNENVALGACKTLLNKTLPDVKSVEVTQSNILDNLISEELDRFKPTNISSDTALTSMTEDEKPVLPNYQISDLTSSSILYILLTEKYLKSNKENTMLEQQQPGQEKIQPIQVPTEETTELPKTEEEKTVERTVEGLKSRIAAAQTSELNSSLTNYGIQKAFDELGASANLTTPAIEEVQAVRKERVSQLVTAIQKSLKQQIDDTPAYALDRELSKSAIVAAFINLDFPEAEAKAAALPVIEYRQAKVN